ncbi:Hypothetical predicted protein, partial [Mytilus galloprovincialis]
FQKKDYYTRDRDEGEYLLPTFLDMTGFEDDDTPLNTELLNIVLCGKLKEGEELHKVINYGKKFGVNAVKEKYFGGKYFGIIPKQEGMPNLLDYFVIENREEYHRVNRVFVVCSANPDLPLPGNLFEAVTDITNRERGEFIISIVAYYITLYGVLTQADKYKSRDPKVFKREKEFMRALGIPKNRFARIKNYCPDIDPNMTYEDTIIPSLDVPVLRLLRQVLTAEPTDQDYEQRKTKKEKYVPNLSDPGIPVYGILTCRDKHPPNIVQDRKESFCHLLALPQCRFAHIINYCDDIDRKGVYYKRTTTCIPSLDVPVLQFMQQVLQPRPNDPTEKQVIKMSMVLLLAFILAVLAFMCVLLSSNP